MVALATGPRVDTSVHFPEPTTRRFALADIALHGQWLFKRLAPTGKTQRWIVDWLRNMMSDNSSLLLATDNGAALFQVTIPSLLDEQPVVMERFVFVMEGHATDGMQFYAEAEKWAKGLHASKLIVEIMTDVPHEAIKDTIGRLYTHQQMFARL